MQRLRQNFLVQFFWLFLAVHIFNCSVDSPDLQPVYAAEDLSINDMESIVEILLEKVFNCQDLIAEHDEDDSNDGECFKIEKPYSFFFTKSFNNHKVFEDQQNTIIPANYIEHYFLHYHPEIVPPPPKA